MSYSFNQADAPGRHETQYFEILGNRGIYHKGWTAGAAHNPPGAGWSHRELHERFGSCTTPQTTGPRRATSQANTRRSCGNYKRLFLIEAARMTCCRSRIASPNG